MSFSEYSPKRHAMPTSSTGLNQYRTVELGRSVAGPAFGTEEYFIRQHGELVGVRRKHYWWRITV